MILPPQRLEQLLRAALAKAYPEAQVTTIVIEPTASDIHGDYTSNMAMKLAKQINQPAREIAQHLLAQMGHAAILTKAEVAGPGFINFFMSPRWLMSHLPKLVADQKFGTNDQGQSRKIVVEFISANPTGPLTLGNGRGAFAGDTLSNVLALSGWKVTREYYLNDIGNQVNILAESVIRRYFQSKGIPTEYPDYCYQGEYVGELAAKLKLDKMKLQDMMTVRDRIKGRVMTAMIKEIQRVVEKKLKVKFNSWMRESVLHERHLDDKVMDWLRRHDLVVEQDGAVWFRTTAFGDDKDRVLIKKDGEKTYLLSDIALRYNRFIQRGFDHEIVYLGADHHGYIGRLQATMAALGFARQLEVEIVQLVRLMKHGQEVKMSKRAGTYVALEELVDEVGLDAARFFFLMHAPDTHMDFDLNLAKERSEKNPVYYVQYAHARMAGIIKNAAKRPVIKSKEPPQPAELALLKQLLNFPGLVQKIAVSYDVQKLPFYAVSLAEAFHKFYTTCRVIDHDKVIGHRMLLVKASRQVLAKTMSLMGVVCPEKM